MVVERMKECNNITLLAEELGLERKLMYSWRAQLEPQRAWQQTSTANARSEAGTGKQTAQAITG